MDAVSEQARSRWVVACNFDHGRWLAKWTLISIFIETSMEYALICRTTDHQHEIRATVCTIPNVICG